MEVLNQIRRKQMYLKRKIYNRLVQWKDNADHSTLEVNGARQVGKTYLINKFADENFAHNQKIVTRDYLSNITKAACNRAISWLYFSGIIGFCAKITELDIMDFKAAGRCYFMDLGVANYYMKRIGTDERALNGTLNENYVFINLKKRQDFPPEIAFETPASATYKGGEIDFVVQSLEGNRRYLVAVKTGKGKAETAQKALKAGKADQILYLKGNTKGVEDGKIITVPIYMLEKYKF